MQMTNVFRIYLKNPSSMFASHRLTHLFRNLNASILLPAPNFFSEIFSPRVMKLSDKAEFQTCSLTFEKTEVETLLECWHSY